jgi:branched-chain amino acid transport system permease protein
MSGCVYALMAAGLALIFGVLRVLNFAHGEFIMLGMYAGYFISTETGLDPYLFLPLIAGATYILGTMVSRVLIERLPVGNMDAQLLLTLGLAYIMQNVALMSFGATPKSLNLDYSSTLWNVGGIYIAEAAAYAAVASAVVMALLYLVLGRTQLGWSLRATADDPGAATAVGINVVRVRTVTFGVGVALAATAGAAISTYRSVNPTSGQPFLLLMFVAIILGGMGSISGAVVGALAVGVSQALAGIVLPLQLQDVTVFLMLLAVLLLRPNGLFVVSRRIA